MSGKLLVVSHSNPYEIGGGSFACHAYAKAFSECFNGNADICVPAESKALIDSSIRYDKIIRVPNPSEMNDVIGQGDIYICPTRIGSGLKLRIMDGLRLGMPVVVHNSSKRGYESMMSTPYFKSFLTAAEFSLAVQELSSQVMGGEDERLLVRNCYLSQFSYECGLDKVKEILNCIVS